MSVTFECGDKNALVAYLCEECEPELRDVISGHLTRCDSCSSEIDGLGWTRRHLEVWTPPMPELGFRMQVPSQEARLLVAGTACRLGAGSGRSRHFRCWSVGRAGARPGCRTEWRRTSRRLQR